jgi:hypothetical protein
MNDSDSSWDSASAARAAAEVAAGAAVIVALGRSEVRAEAAELFVMTSRASRVGGAIERFAVRSLPRKPSSCSGR